MKYTIVEAIHYSDLIKWVNQYIEEDNWIPLGGVCVTPESYYQAMIRKKRPKKIQSDHAEAK